MPGFDGTGPRGMGPMTGGGRGFCNPASPFYGAAGAYPATGVPAAGYGLMPFGYGRAVGGFATPFAFGRGLGFGARGGWGGGMGMGRGGGRGRRW